jgi:hypothetical protein
MSMIVGVRSRTVGVLDGSVVATGEVTVALGAWDPDEQAPKAAVASTIANAGVHP